MGSVVGIFVGGRGTRMGSVPKGVLRTPDGETLLDRWLRVVAECGVPAVLVGAAGTYDLPARIVEDAGRLGPLGGLLGLLRDTRDRGAHSHVVAVACDMPFVTAALLGRLLAAPEVAVVAARRGGNWEPFFARYEVTSTLPHAEELARGTRWSLQPLLHGAVQLPLDADEASQLRDWDTPEDVALDGGTLRR